jgi:hypothetical protein
VKVDPDTGLIEGRYRTVDAYFKGVQEMKSLVDGNSMPSSSSRIRIVLVRCSNPSEFAHSNLYNSRINRHRRFSRTEQQFEHAPQTPQEPDVVERYVDMQIPVRPTLERQFAQELKDAEIPFPETKEDWLALGEANRGCTPIW